MKHKPDKNTLKFVMSRDSIKELYELSEEKLEYLRKAVYITAAAAPKEEMPLLRKSNQLYNREAAKKYAETYAEKPNTNKYPYYKSADCANFISQALKEGGIDMIGSRWDSYISWFCNTTKQNELTRISITWRSARYFRKHWGNENNVGGNRATNYTKMTAKQAIEGFDNIFASLSIGDVIQYGDPLNNDYAYHTQIIHDKGFNSNIGRNDFLIAQHSANGKNISLYTYLSLLKDKNSRFIYLYKI